MITVNLLDLRTDLNQIALRLGSRHPKRPRLFFDTEGITIGGVDGSK